MVTREVAVERFAFMGVDFDTVTREVCALLTKYRHPNTQNGVETFLREYADKKWGLMQMLKKHPNYNGNLQVSVSANFNYRIDRNSVYSTLYYFLDKVNAAKKMIKYTDENGKTFTDYFADDIEFLPMFVKLAGEIPELKEIVRTTSNVFDNCGRYLPSVKKHNDICKAIELFRDYTRCTLNDYMAQRLNMLYPKVTLEDGTVISHGIKAAEGQKTSRAFNKVFTINGFEKDADYLREFPVYADLVKEGVITREIVMSVHPVDYLTMSFGNTWASCHTIDKSNIRNKANGYSGAYCAGTQSYMLDECTMVVYNPVPYTNGKPETADKIFRNMIMYKDGMLIQSRLYPQSNDGAVDLLEEFRHIEQKIICECLGVDYVSGSNGNDTWIKKGESCRYDEYYYSEGLHYRDYTYSSMNGNISYIRGTELHTPHMTIGHKNICPYCGEEHTDHAAYLACYDCR